MSVEIISLLSIFLGLLLMIFLAYRGFSIYIIAPLCSVLIAVMSKANIVDTLSGPYMASFAGFAQRYFLIFLLSASFGKLMNEVGAAQAIAIKTVHFISRFKRNKEFFAICSIVALNVIFTYGGISVFVALFTVVAISKDIFEELDIPWRLYTCGALGSAVFTVSMMPGTPAIQNLIPMSYLGTTPMAAPVLGIISTVISLVLGLGYIYYAVTKAKKNGEGFLPTGSRIKAQSVSHDLDREKLLKMPMWKCLLPSVLLILTLNALHQSAIVALFVANVATIILYWAEIRDIYTLNGIMKAGAINAIGSVTSVGAAVGFGGVVASVAGYQVILTGLQNLPLPPVFQVIVAVNVAAGVTGSSSGGLGIAFNSLTDQFLSTGLNPEVIHRLSVMASGGLDTLPHCGAIIFGMVEVEKLTHKEAYNNYFWLTVVLPIAVTIIAGFLAMAGVV